jgi:hypothetical protein
MLAAVFPVLVAKRVMVIRPLAEPIQLAPEGAVKEPALAITWPRISYEQAKQLEKARAYTLTKSSSMFRTLVSTEKRKTKTVFFLKPESKRVRILLFSYSMKSR